MAGGMSFLAVWGVLFYLATVALSQNTSSNGTYTNPILNVLGAADPSVFLNSPMAPTKADAGADG
jgi:hypothetical protein